MKVQEVKLDNNQRRYLLVDDMGLPIMPVAKYLKRIDRFIWLLCYDILDELEIDTNFIFVKLRDTNKGKPLEYQDVSDLFKRLKKKTGIDVHDIF